MRVYVLNQRKKPLMPCSPVKARHLLKNKKAKVLKREPFVIQLLSSTGESKQEITLGVDSGSKVAGFSATTPKKELYSGEVELRNDIVKLLSNRRESRRTRRNRLRYRKARFLNRVKSKNKGWLAPSIENKINTHIKIINDLHELLPISKIIIEVASFDMQKIKNPEINGTQYQEGNQLNFWNVREYVLARDNHSCKYCKGKSKDRVLQVHHIESRKIGGDSPENLITLCKTCHQNLHKGLISLDLKRGLKLNHASFMGIMRWELYRRVKNLYSNVCLTFGYITKHTRIKNNLPKEHRIDAKCISKNPKAIPSSIYYYQKKVRCHNRQIHKSNFIKGHKKKANQAPFEVKGFRLFDQVEYENQLYYIFGRRKTGYFDIRKLDGTKVNKGSVNYKLLKLIKKRRTILMERKINYAQNQFLPHFRSGGFLGLI